MRQDLVALTPEKVAALANAGLVKRALREIEEGKGPALDEDSSGVVRGTFADGVVATLPPGVLLRDAPCTCGAVSVCRHRVAVALAYARAHGSTAPAEPWSPAAIDDAALEKALGKRVLDRARRLASGPIAATLTPGAIPEAALPTCTVRFLVPLDPSYARCDCALGAGCEHVALAVLAFREAERKAPLEGPRTVELGAPATADQESRPLDEALALARTILVDGVAHASPALAARFARVESALERAGLVWPLEIVSELEDALDAYRERSARYRVGTVARLLVELAARARAAATPGELPPSVVLGQGESRETPLDQVRLLSLGARIEGDERARKASVYLADLDSATVLVLERAWTFGEHETPPSGHELARRQVAPGIGLGLLARGQLVSRAVIRRANRGIRLGGRGGLSRTSVAPQTGDWGGLPASLLVACAASLERTLAARPPWLVAPRVLAETVRVVPVAAVREVRYSPGDQALSALLELPGGSTLRLERVHESAAPHALSVLAEALAGPVRFVSGEVRRGHGGLAIDPLAVVGERVLVLDLEEPPSGATLDVGRGETAVTRRDDALERAASELESLVHPGLAHDPGARPRLEAAGARLEAAGLVETAKRIRALAASLGGDGAASAWFSVSIRVALGRELVAL